MRTLFTRRYVRHVEAISLTEKLLGLFILLLVAGVVAAFVLQATTDQQYLFAVDEAVYGEGAPADTVESPFLAPDVEGWRAPKSVGRFTPETLYIKIDGRADLYLQFNVVGLTFGAYYHATDADRTADVYWYDMGTPDNAMGIYRAEAAPDADAVGVGREGYQVGGAVFFWKGASYVQVLPAEATEADARAALRIAEQLAALIADTGQPQWALEVLPAEARLADSFEFIGRDAFGLEFLSDVFTARYAASGGQITLFVHRAADEEAARSLLDQYVGYFEQYGRVVWNDPDAARGLVAGEVYGAIDVVFAKGRYLGGVAGADDVPAARQAAAAFADGLTAP